MRETPLSNCERDFILENLKEQRRLDGRNAYDYRNIRISFGVSLGCCHVEIGKTKVLAQVSCEVGTPKPTRPHDGLLFVNVEMSPMASPAFEPGRQSEEGVELSRLMERCLKESRCMDTESLCIVSGEKVWVVRVDVHVLNHEGNILDCASIAAIAAMAHFKRPDVSVNGEEITIHPPDERAPVGLSIHHMPLLVTFAFFLQGKYLLVDPREKEEKVMEGRMVIGMNKHREICTLQVTGQMLLLKDQVCRCSSIAVTKVMQTTELILKALENDKAARAAGEKKGFAELVSDEGTTANRRPQTNIEVKEEIEDEEDLMIGDDENPDEIFGNRIAEDDDEKVEILAKGVGAIGEGGASSWLDLPSKPADESSQLSGNIAKAGHKRGHRDQGGGNSSSEEEETTVVK